MARFKQRYQPDFFTRAFSDSISVHGFVYVSKQLYKKNANNLLRKFESLVSDWFIIIAPVSIQTHKLEVLKRRLDHQADQMVNVLSCIFFVDRYKMVGD